MVAGKSNDFIFPLSGFRSVASRACSFLSSKVPFVFFMRYTRPPSCCAAGMLNIAPTLCAMSSSMCAYNGKFVPMNAMCTFWFWMRHVSFLVMLSVLSSKLLAVSCPVRSIPFAVALFTSAVRLLSYFCDEMFAASTVVWVWSKFTRAKSRNYLARSIVRFWMGFKPFLVAAQAAAFSASANLCQYVFFVPAQLRITSYSSFPHNNKLADFNVWVNRTGYGFGAV